MRWVPNLICTIWQHEQSRRLLIITEYVIRRSFGWPVFNAANSETYRIGKVYNRFSSITGL
jgi:hypothetical protein